MKNSNSKATGVLDEYILIKDLVYDAPGKENDAIETDIQVAFMNMLHDKGLITDSVHSAAIHKIHKGV
jgi:hypothetical protein